MAEEKDMAPAAPEAEADPGEVTAVDGETLIRLVLEAHEARLAEAPPARIDGVLVGVLSAIEPIRVTFPGAPEGGVPARAMAALGPDDAGCEVALLFEGGDPARPVVMGKMAVHPASAASRPEVRTDGERLELRADKEIVLSCGKASITLTRAGKILIRGAYVLSRSSGVHRIQGGSVQIN
jgi:hypothetical protein